MQRGEMQERRAELLSFSHHRTRLGAAVGFFVMAGYLNALAAVIAGYRTPNVVIRDVHGHITNATALPDLGHALGEQVGAMAAGWGWGSGGEEGVVAVDYNDAMLNLFGFPIIFFGLSHPKRWMLVRRVTIVYGAICLLRAVCVVVTSMPDASLECAAQFAGGSGAYKTQPMFPRVLERALRVMLAPSDNITCGDMIFSGHTVLVTLCANLMLRYYTLRECNTPLVRLLQRSSGDLFLPALRLYFCVGGLLSYCVFVTSRLHYTVDVVIAIFVTQTLWWIYHAMAEVPVLRARSRLFSWLEADEAQQADMNVVFGQPALSVSDLLRVIDEVLLQTNKGVAAHYLRRAVQSMVGRATERSN